jgi:signal transduction histidine kinase
MLMAVFLGGYLVAFGLVAAGRLDLLAAVTAVIFLLGAVFVFLTMLVTVRLTSSLDEALRARDEFISAASHELRTPLAALRLQVGNMELVGRGNEKPAPTEKLMRRLERIGHQVDRLQELVERLLDVSRIVEGRLRIELEEVDLAEVTREVASRFSEQAAQTGCELVLRVDAPVLGLWDRLRIDQVVTNLITNAIKFGVGKPVEVEVTSDGATARLFVRDYGVGIAAEDQARIFERFERAVSKHISGLGLGLWITRQVVIAMGGEIRVESRPQEGATFTVELPRRGPAVHKIARLRPPWPRPRLTKLPSPT